MNKKQIVTAVMKTVDNSMPMLLNALPLDDRFVFTNAKMVILDKDNHGLPVSTDDVSGLTKGISDMFNQEYDKTLSIDRGELDAFIKWGKLRNGTGKNIFLKHGKEYHGFNAKWLYWIMDYAKTDVLYLAKHKNSDCYNAIVEGENCKCLLLPVRILETPKEHVFPVKSYTAEESIKKEKKAVKKRDFDLGAITYSMTWAEHVNTLIRACDKGLDSDEYKETKKIFKRRYNKVKDTHKYPSGTFYHAETMETANEMIDIVETIASLDGVAVDVIGRFLWTKGRKQKANAKILKSLGFTLQENKGKFCKSYFGYERHDGKFFNFAKIKAMYGTAEESI